MKLTLKYVEFPNFHLQLRKYSNFSLHFFFFLCCIPSSDYGPTQLLPFIYALPWLFLRKIVEWFTLLPFTWFWIPCIILPLIWLPTKTNLLCYLTYNWNGRKKDLIHALWKIFRVKWIPTLSALCWSWLADYFFPHC